MGIRRGKISGPKKRTPAKRHYLHRRGARNNHSGYWDESMTLALPLPLLCATSRPRSWKGGWEEYKRSKRKQATAAQQQRKPCNFTTVFFLVYLGAFLLYGGRWVGIYLFFFRFLLIFFSFVLARAGRQVGLGAR